ILISPSKKDLPLQCIVGTHETWRQSFLTWHKSDRAYDRSLGAGRSSFHLGCPINSSRQCALIQARVPCSGSDRFGNNRCLDPLLRCATAVGMESLPVQYKALPAIASASGARRC
ncbi:hypothetical protein IscW_ISCW020602, partial [Ixodes scapularis]